MAGLRAPASCQNPEHRFRSHADSSNDWMRKRGSRQALTLCLGELCHEGGGRREEHRRAPCMALDWIWERGKVAAVFVQQTSATMTDPNSLVYVLGRDWPDIRVIVGESNEGASSASGFDYRLS